MNKNKPSDTKTFRTELMRIGSFAVVGLGGYFVHAGGLSLFNQGFGLSPILAWFPAFLLAVTFTWWLNRIFTFRALKPARKRAEAAGYMLVQSLGAVINYAVFFILVVTGLPFLSVPVIALAGGSGVAFIFNYLALRRFVFRGGDQPDA